MTHSVTGRTRADLLLCERGLAPTRTRAQALIRAGLVTADGRPLARPGELLGPGVLLAVAPGPDFVSRGGEKLDGALAALGVSLAGAVVADIGASTGGFTDCALRRGALRVHAVDVGHGQLHPRLAGDARVTSREGTNARHLSAGDFPEPIDVVLVDASFIGAGKLAPAMARILPEGGRLVVLVKPQFEVGPAALRRTKGVVRDPLLRARAIDGARRALVEAGFTVLAECDSPLPGPRGNLERFIAAERVAAGDVRTP